jgi:hypothetical protein
MSKIYIRMFNTHFYTTPIGFGSDWRMKNGLGRWTNKKGAPTAPNTTKNVDHDIYVRLYTQVSNAAGQEAPLKEHCCLYSKCTK